MNFNNLKLIVPLLLGSLLLPLPTANTSSAIPIQNSPSSHWERKVVFSANSTEGVIQIIDDRLVLPKRLQKDLKDEIAKANNRLDELTRRFHLNFNRAVGLAYVHKGQDDWSLQFTFGGLVLNTDSEIILPIQQIFVLKELFRQTQSVRIEDKQYPTTQDMRQLGPILHSPDQIDLSSFDGSH
jgi:hypothetical protein